MEIKTKYNIGDKVYFLNGKKADVSCITDIYINVYRDTNLLGGGLPLN